MGFRKMEKKKKKLKFVNEIEIKRNKTGFVRWMDIETGRGLVI